MKISRQGALAGGLIFLALVAGPILGAAQEAGRTGGALVEQTEKGLINWSAGYVEAEGAGAVSDLAPSARPRPMPTAISLKQSRACASRARQWSRTS